jgi:hypothetical protein
LKRTESIVILRLQTFRENHMVMRSIIICGYYYPLDEMQAMIPYGSHGTDHAPTIATED